MMQPTPTIPKQIPHPFSIEALILSAPTTSQSQTPEKLPFTLSTTRRKKPLLNVAGQSFYLQKKNRNGSILFVCASKRKSKCPASVTMNPNMADILRTTLCHNHD